MPTAIPPALPAVPIALGPAVEFIERQGRDASLTVLCHGDADGVVAGAVLVRALRRCGRRVTPVVTGKGEGAWSVGVRERVAAPRPDALVVTDLGCRAEAVLDGVPTLFVDHHRPDGVPDGSVLLSGYGARPTPTSALLAWRLADRLGVAEDLDWLAAIGTLSDVGDIDAYTDLARVRTRHRITHLREATALVNAPRRTAAGDGMPALDALLAADGPAAIARGTGPRIEALRSAKAEVARALAAARTVAPRLVGDVALLRLDSGCQIHPLIATQWVSRLKRSIVIAANCGFLPGRVNFAMRTALDVNLLDFLALRRPEGAGLDYGRGHDRATGGSLSAHAWNAFARTLGFGAQAAIDGDPPRWIGLAATGRRAA